VKEYFGKMVYKGYIEPDPFERTGHHVVRVYIEGKGWTQNAFTKNKKIQIGDNYFISKSLVDKLQEIQKEHGKDVRLGFKIENVNIVDVWVAK